MSNNPIMERINGTKKQVAPQDAYENLANAIIVQAFEDHMGAVRTMKTFSWDKKSKEYVRALSTKNECERFFRSEWFKALTTVDGEVLLRELARREADDKQTIL